MKRSVVLALAALAALTLPSLAAAKEISKVELCGDEACRELTGAAAQRLVGGGEGMSEPAAPPGPYYRVRLTAKADGRSESWSIFYVPSEHRLALPDGNWQQVGGATRTAFERATAGLEPYPTPMLERVVIDGLAVHDPTSYATLFEAGTSDGAVPSSLADWVPIEFRFKGQTPWSSERPYVFFSPADSLLQRGIEVVKIPNELAASIRARESLASPAGFPWAVAGVIALALALAGCGGAIWLARRHDWQLGNRRRPVPTA
jgi:hypothetical protein